eukprot:6213021-Pleurochrysis_carterae.AAC.1
MYAADDNSITFMFNKIVWFDPKARVQLADLVAHMRVLGLRISDIQMKAYLKQRFDGNRNVRTIKPYNITTYLGFDIKNEYRVAPLTSTSTCVVPLTSVAGIGVVA